MSQITVEVDGQVTVVEETTGEITIEEQTTPVTVEVGTSGPQGSAGPQGIAGPPSPPTFTMTGELEVAAGTIRYYVEQAVTIASVRASVGTPATGSGIIIDVNKNGSSIFGAPASQPTIEPGSNTELVVVGDASMIAGDYLTVDVDQIGSTFAGENLTVTITLE